MATSQTDPTDLTQALSDIIGFCQTLLKTRKRDDDYRHSLVIRESKESQDERRWFLKSHPLYLSLSRTKPLFGGWKLFTDRDREAMSVLLWRRRQFSRTNETIGDHRRIPGLQLLGGTLLSSGNALVQGLNDAWSSINARTIPQHRSGSRGHEFPSDRLSRSGTAMCPIIECFRLHYGALCS
jgi:hypothetical protein